MSTRIIKAWGAGAEAHGVVPDDACRLFGPERPLAAEDRTALRRQRSKLEALMAPGVERQIEAPGVVASGPRGGSDPMIPSGMADEDLVNALAQYLDLEPVEKQALLERHCLRSRAESLVELLEMKVMIARTPGGSHVAH